MKYDLAAMARRTGLKRRETTFAPILVTSALANDLAAINRAILTPWNRAAELIEPIYEVELARRAQNGGDRRIYSDSIDDLTNLFAQLSNEVERLVMELTPSMRDWGFQLEQWHRGKWARTILAGTDIDVSALIGPTDAIESIETFMARNSALIRNTSDETRAKVSDIVFRGLQKRAPARQVGKAIAEATDLARKRANRIAADQAVKLSAALDRQRQREAGLDNWKWRHSGKLHFRPEHKARNGKLYNDKTAPEDEPGELPFCGCLRQAVLIIDGIEL